jgi:O-antigen ligase
MDQPLESRSQFKPLQLASVLLPLAAIVAVGYAGGAPAQLIKLGIVGVIALAGVAFVFIRPAPTVIFLCFYAYAGLSMLMPVSAAAPIVMLLLGVALCGFARGDENQLVDPVFWWSVGLFALLVLQSLLVAHYPGLVVVRLNNYVRALALTYLIVHFVRTPEQLRMLTFAIAFSAVATIVLGALAMRFGLMPPIYYIGGVNIPRFTGLHMDPNYGAAHMCAAIPFWVFLIKSTKRVLLRVAFSLGFVGSIAGVFLTFSRGALVALVFVLGAILLREFKSVGARLIAAGLVFLGAMLSPGYYWERISSLTELTDATNNDGSLMLRVQAFKASWKFFTQHPFTGIGLNNFVERAAHSVRHRMVVHNTFMEILVGTGIFGLLSFLGIYFSGMRSAYQGFRGKWKVSPPWMRSLAYYSAISLVSTMFSALFLSISYRYLMCIPLATCLIVGNLLRRDQALSDSESIPRHA